MNLIGLCGLLGKPGRFRFREVDFETDMRRLARYAADRIRTVLKTGEAPDVPA